MYRNGDICCTAGQFHPEKMMVWKFRPSVVYLRYVSTVDEKFKLQEKKVKLQDFKIYCARGREDVRVVYLKKNYVVK